MFKKILLVCLGLTLCLPAFAAASDDGDLTLARIQSERKVLVEGIVKPSPQQSKAFWDAYWAYRETVANLDNRSKKLIDEYEKSFAALNDDQAERMLKEAAKIEVERVEARQKIVKKLRKILIPKQIVRFLQIENKMDAIMNLDRAINIPFND